MIGIAYSMELVARLEQLREHTRELRYLTADPELQWELTQAEAVADVVLAQHRGTDPVLIQTHIDFLINLLAAIRERIAK